MKEITITGWESGLQTISLIKLVRTLKELSLKEAKEAVEAMMEGSPLALGVFDDQHAKEIQSSLETMHAKHQMVEL